MVDRKFSWRRCAAWSVAIGLHAVLLVALSVPVRLVPDRPPEAGPEAHRSAALRVELPTPARPLPALAASGAATPPRPERVPRGRPDVLEAPAASSSAAITAVRGPPARRLSILDDAARPILPDEPLFRPPTATASAGWHAPGDGSEDDVFYRPRALDPATTRFAKAWAPTTTLGREWYDGLMRATTGVVRIPLNPKFDLVCGASLAGLGGGCAIVRSSPAGVIVERPPPPPWERTHRVQCRELRAALEAATDEARVAALLDRLAALCAETTKPGAGPGSGD